MPVQKNIRLKIGKWKRRKDITESQRERERERERERGGGGTASFQFILNISSILAGFDHQRNFLFLK